MNLIAAVDSNWGIGKNNDLLFYIPEDLKHFKDMTLGKTVVMGFNTLLSLPGSKPLEGRRNIVLMRGGLLLGDAEVANSVEDLYSLAGADLDDVFVIGGAQIYELLEPRCNRAYITKIHADGKAQVFFPILDQKKEWKLVSESEVHTYKGLSYTFCVYERIILLSNTFTPPALKKLKKGKVNSGAQRLEKGASSKTERLSQGKVEHIERLEKGASSKTERLSQGKVEHIERLEKGASSKTERLSQGTEQQPNAANKKPKASKKVAEGAKPKSAKKPTKPKSEKPK